MDELLTRVLEAHGGLDAWSKVTEVTVRLALDGPFWDGVGWPQIRGLQTVTLDPAREYITFTPFLGDGRTAVYQGDTDRVRILDPAGHVVAEGDNVGATFPPYDETARWDQLQVAYFTGTANWNYLTEPFLFTYPGVEAHEIEPWEEDGETWRRLAVRFPPNLPNHNPDQTFYYDADFRQRRMDYAPDVTGNAPIAHYTHDPVTYDGFVFYTRRLVHFRDAEGQADQSVAPITIDVKPISVDLRPGDAAN